MPALRAHPAFPQASRAMAIGLTGFYRGGPLLNWLMDDRARVVLSHVVLHSHYARDPADPSSGLTPTRMKQLCSEFDLCSPGRATAMVSLMRFAGYVAPDPDSRRSTPAAAGGDAEAAGPAARAVALAFQERRSGVPRWR